jgi:hypothetical protein
MQVTIDGKPCMLDILNASRLVELTTALEQWIRDVEGFLLVYSITSRSSFASIKNFHRQIRRVKDSTTPLKVGFQYHPIMLVGNKCDQVTEREVSTLEGHALAQELGFKFVETSAKKRINVEKAFYDPVRLIRLQWVLFEGGANLNARGWHRDIALQPPSVRGDCTIVQQLLSFLVGSQERTPCLDKACDWYRTFLAYNAEKYWPLIRSSLRAVEGSSESLSQNDFAVVISFVHEVARKLVIEKDVALCDILDPLANNGYFKPGLDHDENGGIATQLVFTVIGWLRKSRSWCIFTAELTLRSPPLRSTIRATSSQTADQG